MKPLPALLVSAVALVAAIAPGCALLEDRTAGPAAAARVTGRLRADHLPSDAVIEVYRDDGGFVVPLPGTVARPDTLGRFETPPLVPGRYVLVVRTKDAPPSSTVATIPGRTDVDLRLASVGPGSTITLISPPGAPGTRTCRLVPDQSRGPVPDRREVVLVPGQEARLAGLAPGLWHVDVLPDGATADIVVPSGDTVPRFVVEPPAAPSLGGSLQGLVVRLRGRPAFGAAVTARACSPDGMKIEPWGRVGLVDREGRYRIDRLTAGTAFVRVEARDACFLVLPGPELIQISPPAPSERGYTVEP